MKFVLILTLFCSSVFAAEVSTDCPAMNGTREKIVKDSGSRKVKTSSQGIAQ
jgi:hypothetical protein